MEKEVHYSILTDKKQIKPLCQKDSDDNKSFKESSYANEVTCNACLELLKQKEDK